MNLWKMDGFTWKIFLVKMATRLLFKKRKEVSKPTHLETEKSFLKNGLWFWAFFLNF